MDIERVAVEAPEDGSVPPEERAAIAQLAGLTPVERFDQLVRTVRFIVAARRSMGRHTGA